MPSSPRRSIDLPESRPEDVTITESSTVLLTNDRSLLPNIPIESLSDSDKSEAEAENKMFRELQKKVDQRIERENAEQVCKNQATDQESKVNYAIDDINDELYQNQEGHPLIAAMMNDY